MKSLLIVDDNRFNLDFISALLTSLGYSTIVAQNGKDALRLAAERRPDAILMDIELDDDLGDQSGLEVTIALKSDRVTAEIPVLALTGLDPADIAGSIEAAGFVAFIRKPASIGTLKAALTKILGV